jgi:segregation and condensation protein B
MSKKISENQPQPPFDELAQKWASAPESAPHLLDQMFDETTDHPMNELMDQFTDRAESTSEEDLQRIAQAMAHQEKISQSERLTQIQSAEDLIPEIDPQAQLEAEIAEDLRLQNETHLENPATQSSEIELQLDANEMQSCIEALLFISDKPLSQERLRSLLGSHFEPPVFQAALDSLRERYASVHHGIELIEVSGGYQLRTKPGRADLAKKLVRVQTQRLSSGSMETLAIIAYQQPVMKEEIDKIRGVDSSYFVRGLLDRKLIKISGRSELPGRPMLYGTTPEFLEVFGLKDLSSLPSLRELEQMIPQSQSGNPEDEDPKTREMRRLVSEMKADHSSALHYNPKEDEKILKEIRDQVNLIPTSTPYLDELKAAETLALQQQNPPPALQINPD